MYTLTCVKLMKLVTLFKQCEISEAGIVAVKVRVDIIVNVIQSDFCDTV